MDPGSGIIATIVFTGSPGDPDTLQGLRSNTAGTAGMGGSWRGVETGIQTEAVSLSNHVPNLA